MCGKHMKKCQFELGGSDPCIVLDDADIDSAVEKIVMARLSNSGQECISPKRLIVFKEVYEEFKNKIIETIKKNLEAQPLGPIARADLH